MIHVLIFLSAATIDALWVAWFHFNERKAPIPTAVISMSLAGLSLFGMGAALRSWEYAPAYLLGIGAGSYVAVRWRR